MANYSNKRKDGLVYSTEKGKTCPKCENAITSCSCRKGDKAGTSDGVVRISRQTKGRKGSGVSLISGVPLPEAELKKLAKTLKQKCGTGGTVKNGLIEIQGDHRSLLAELLKKEGYNVKLAGG